MTSVGMSRAELDETADSLTAALQYSAITYPGSIY
jgi:hypothetical protein